MRHAGAERPLPSSHSSDLAGHGSVGQRRPPAGARAAIMCRCCRRGGCAAVHRLVPAEDTDAICQTVGGLAAIIRRLCGTPVSHAHLQVHHSHSIVRSSSHQANLQRTAEAQTQRHQTLTSQLAGCCARSCGIRDRELAINVSAVHCIAGWHVRVAEMDGSTCHRQRSGAVVGARLA